jgi:hypothetical protein
MKKIISAALFAISSLFVCMGQDCFLAGDGGGGFFVSD